MPFIRSENYSWRWPSAGEHRSIIQTISRFLGSSERLQVRVWTIKCWTPFTIKITISVRRAVFKWLSKVIAWLRFLRSLIGLKDSCQFFNEWESKPKPIAPCTRDFFRVSSELQLIARNCDWFIALFAAVVIGRSNCFGLGFGCLNCNRRFDLITARSAVVGSWEPPPNIWLTVAKNAFVGWALNFRFRMLLKSAVIWTLANWN